MAKGCLVRLILLKSECLTGCGARIGSAEYEDDRDAATTA